MNCILSLFSEWRCSLVVLLCFALFAIIAAIFSKHGKQVPFSTNHILFVGTFLAAAVYFWPWYSLQLSPWQAFFSSIQHAFRLFSFDGDFLEKISAFTQYPEEEREFYLTYGSFLFAFAPIITLSFILSFFKNLISHIKYLSCFWATAHVFSELNEKTLALAQSINNQSKHFLWLFPRNLIVFTDIIDRKEEQSLELLHQAKQLGAILFRQDIASVHFKSKHSLRKVHFYLISEDEAEKIRHAERIMDHYDFKRVSLHVFSDGIRTELLMTTKKTTHIKVVRVNDIQSLIYDNLDKNGIHLFKRARHVPGERDAVISAVIVGLGKYGHEMLKALVWFCQLEGYKLKINVFDADKKATARFKELCPELMDRAHNNIKKEGDAYYDITIHSGIDVDVPSFEDKLKQITDATYIFVCLGDDEINLSAATKIRAMCQRINYLGDGRKPDIETVIYDSNVKERMGITWEQIQDYEACVQDPEKKFPIYGATNFKQNMYQILMIGDLEHFYSYDTVIDSDLIEAGLKIHIGYSVEYQKVVYAENQMLEQWAQFVADHGLAGSWEAHLKAWKEKENLQDSSPFSLSAAKQHFSFMTLEEEETARTSPAAHLKLKNTATTRIEDWEKEVYAKFNALLKEKEASKEWAEIEKQETQKAEKSFLYEYNYRSSIAKAIHQRLKKKLGFNVKKWEDLTLREKVELGKVEHVRWNAYMRTEGYRYFPERSDLGKLHNKLVPVSQLSYDDLRKDA